MDFSSWWPEYFKKTCLCDDSYGEDIPKKELFISKYRTMNFSSRNPSSIECNMNIAGLTADSFKLRNTKIPIQPPNKKAYVAILPINIKKMEDIKKLLVYIPQERMDLWASIVSRPTKTTSTEETFQE